MKHSFVSKSKAVILALIFLLVFNGVFASIPVAAESDSEPPVVHNVEVSPQEVEVGDEVTIQAKVTDDNSGVRSARILFYTPSRNRNVYIPLSFNPETELWEGVYEIKESDEEGSWPLYFISAEDYAGNSKHYHPNDFENSEQIAFQVVNPEGDSEPPVVHNVEVSPQEVGVGDEVTIQAEVTDDNSGVRSARILFYTPSRNRNVYIPLSFNPETELWEGVYEIKETNEEGSWPLYFVSAEDYAGNSKHYHPSDFENLEQIAFQVVNPEGDSEPPVVQNVEVSPQEVGVGDEVTIQAEVTDDNSGVRSARILFYTPSRNRNVYIPLSFNPETELWEGVYEIKESDEEGSWPLYFVSAEDYAGNSKHYHPSDFENANEIGFTKIESKDTGDPEDGSDKPEESLEPLSYHYTTSNETWYNEDIDGDLFIGPESILTINGDVTVNGNVYVFGAMRNYGDLTITGTLEARSINWGSSTLYNGTVLMLGGSNQIASIRSSNQMWEVPVEFYNESFLVKDGKLVLKGATVPVVDLYIDGEKVNVNENGTFTISLEEISSNEITYKTVDVFGHEMNDTIDVVHEGVPVWNEGHSISVEYKNDTSVSISWGTATEENGIAFYHLYQDGEKVGQVEGTEKSYEFSNLQSSTSYEFMVKAKGVSGKLSDPLKLTIEMDKSAEEIANEEAINEAYSYIDSLPEEDMLTLDDELAVKGAREKVESALNMGISEESIENLSKLDNLEKRLVDLKVLYEEKIEAISKAEEVINALPTDENVEISDKLEVTEARTLVEEAFALGAQETDIRNYEKLIGIEAKIEDLENTLAFKAEAILIVEKAVDGLPNKEDVTLEDASNVAAARQLVEEALEAGALNSEISNLAKLVGLEERLSELKDEKPVSLVRLDQLPDKNKIQLSDVSRHWAKDDINTLTRKEIILGYPDASFGPNRNITRAEVMVVVSRIITQFPQENAGWNFNDSSPTWANNAILGGVSLGLIQGYPTNKFGANDQITRAELAVILDRVVQLGDLDVDQKESPIAFKDNIPTWAEEAIANMAQLGIVNGYEDQTFRPHANATRAEVATVISRILQ